MSDASKPLPQLKCDNCKSELGTFTGMHEMVKGKKHKLVCGLCFAQLEIKGWKKVFKIAILSM